MDWGGAAISNATWTGPRLRDVLGHLGWKEADNPAAKHVWVDGKTNYDHGFNQKVQITIKIHHIYILCTKPHY